MRICVVGCGYVGLVVACSLSICGHSVCAVERDQKKLSLLRQNKMPFYEKGLQAMLLEARKKNALTFTDDLRTALENSDLVFVTVGTPSLADGRVDLGQVRSVAEGIAELATKPVTVVMKSTVPPGTGRALCEAIFSKASVPIKYVSNPEFLREGEAVFDWLHPDRIVIGVNNPSDAEGLLKVYQHIEAPKLVMDVTSAEMVKYAANAFLATKISFINEIANLCELVGADILQVSKGVGLDKRIGPSFLRAGLGYGGSCFPKDTKALDYVSSFNGHSFNLLKAVIQVNAEQRIRVVRKLEHALTGLTGRRIGILGLAFKPGTDDTREAPAIDIATQLLSQGAIVHACDPVVELGPSHHLSNLTYKDPYEAVKGCQAVLLATEWDMFLRLDWSRVKELMEPPYVVLDGRNVLDKDELTKKGFMYLGIGR